MARVDKHLLIAGMDNTLQSYFLKGKKNWSIQLPSEIVSVSKMDHTKNDQLNCFLVACRNGEIRLYNQKNLVDQFELGGDVCNGICFGIFGREEGCMLINTKSGSLQAKILARQAKLSSGAVKPGPPPEQDIPLKIP